MALPRESLFASHNRLFSVYSRASVVLVGSHGHRWPAFAKHKQVLPILLILACQCSCVYFVSSPSNYVALALSLQPDCARV